MKKIPSQKLKRMFNAFLVLPFLVIVTVTAIYFAFWRTDPLIRFCHMFWVLGFWMMGTLAIFAFLLRTRQKIGASIYLLVLSIAAIVLAVYFTPLSRFTDIFPTQASLLLPASIGAFNLLTSWLIAFRLRTKIAEPHIY